MSQKPDGTVSLEIDSAKESDAGKYQLKASNSKGSAKSTSDVMITG